MMRKLAAGLTCGALLACVLAFLTGTLAMVATHGNSMEPRITKGDLVIVRASTSYDVGEVVAYRSSDLRQVVLHRISAEDHGRFIFRGDNNNFDDPEQPTQQELIGQELIHIPAGAVWLDRLMHPAALGVVAFGLLSGGGAVGVSRRRANRRKRRKMAQHAASRARRWAADGPTWLRSAVVAGATAGALGVIVGLLSWTQPVTDLTSTAALSGRTMTFSYDAEVPPTAAYDGTSVTSPAPIFRKVTDQLDLTYDYRGDPGTVTVDAELSGASGWRSKVPLQEAISFSDRAYTGTVQLDISTLEARAQAAADAIGIPIEQVQVSVIPTITTEGGDVFAPPLSFILTPSQLSLAEGPAALNVRDAATTARETRTVSTLGFDKVQVSVSVLRIASVAVTLTGLLALWLGTMVLRRNAASEAAAIQRRYAAMLLPVEPVSSPSGRPVIDVTNFRALARLAERYGVLVMHWTRSGVDTFVVHDDGITYRYRTGSGPAQASSPGDESMAAASTHPLP